MECKGCKREKRIGIDEKRGIEWKWIRVIVIEVDERKNCRGMDENEWIVNMDANGNEKQR